MVFTMENSEFLNNFYDEIYDYAHASFEEINKSFLNNPHENYSMLTNKELVTLIMLNKSFYQEIYGFFLLVDKKILLPAYNNLRSAIEILRLVIVYWSSEEFRKEYINNTNIDFIDGNDYPFMQKKVLKIMEEKEKELRNKTVVPFSVISYSDMTKGSPISNMHSELSKWSHLININLLKINYYNIDRIFLGIENEMNDTEQSFLRKYLECLWHILCIYTFSFPPYIFSQKYYEQGSKLDNLYGEFIDIFYKNKESEE